MMIEREYIHRMSIHILSIAILLILLQWQQESIIIKEEIKKYFIWCILLTVVVVLVEIGCSLVDNTAPENRAWSIIFNVIGFGVSPFIFLIESNFYDLNQTRKRYWVYVLALVNLFVAIMSPYTGGIFYVSEDCEYSRGPFFYFYIVIFGFSILVTMQRKINAIKYYPRYFRTRIINSTCLMLIGLLVQVFFPKYIVSWMIISIYLVFCYALFCEANSMIDSLTGLLNRAAFDKMIHNIKIQRNKQCFLVMIDVNDFKTVNDVKGHLYGDFCLKEIATILIDVFKVNAHVFRFGGDEFSVLLRTTQNSNIEEYLMKIKEKITNRQRKYQAFPGIAVGYEKLEIGKELREIINQADSKMYQNKQEMKVKQI